MFESTACLSCDPRNRHGYCEDDCQGKQRRSGIYIGFATTFALLVHYLLYLKDRQVVPKRSKALIVHRGKQPMGVSISNKHSTT
ncbi:hypothetical protein F2P81_020077 [Scophthalmus maximus]|uniref:Transmembrane protein n=1 Tax=Scophthalmus maximus TaxID=52904 RepID=A0A6A4RX00_SCOMX|nr:hypothetical protein F2P81_020077 [Scophthalmus maximus]